MSVDRSSPNPPATGGSAAPAEGLELFHPIVQDWFRRRYGRPSPPQRAAWPVIARGEHTLLLAPTGSGKTLAAFFVFLDRLFRRMWEPPGPGASEGSPVETGVHLLYVSPLKALDNDIHRNLEEPLEGIAALARAQGLPAQAPTRAVRTGDTPPSARRAMVRRPPQILITTPESLLLLLLAPRAREMLKTVRAVIVDEIHQLAGSKRGVQLALTLEWLEAWAGHSIQRVGLSATQRPLERIAAFLGGDRPVTIVDAGPPAGAGSGKGLDLLVEAPADPFRRSQEALGRPPTWPVLAARIVELIRSHRSTIVFVQNRGQAERLTRELNELAGEPLVRSHHGSLSREVREQVEADLKAGRLRGLVATSTLELGIDVGAVDLVIQVESPKSVAATLQRVGRAGHLLTQTSKGRILAKTPLDLVEAVAVAQAAREGAVEETRVPENCLDVLAQQVAAMAAAGPEEGWEEERLFRLIRRAYPYRHLSRAAFRSVLKLLAGGYSHPVLGRLKPRIEWNRIEGRIEGLPGTRMAVATQGGTIPDRGLYQAVTHDRRLVGELDEEFVFESRVGDVFVLGNTTWQVDQIGPDRVVVSPAPGRVPRLPFWRGDPVGRSRETGEQVGQLLEALARRLEGTAHLPGPEAERAAVAWLQEHYPADEQAARLLVALARRQRAATGFLPTHQRLLLEFFPDEVGDWRAVLHAPFGARLNRAWLLAFQARAREVLGLQVEGVVADEGLLLRFPGWGEAPLALADLDLLPDLEALISEEATGSPLFAVLFRHAAARALLIPRSTALRRRPLWQQRLRASDLLEAFRAEPDFPLVVEALRELWHEALDVPGLRSVLEDVKAGRRRLEVVQRPAPSPFAAGLVFRFLGDYVYHTDSPRAERRAQLLQLSQQALREALGSQVLRELLDREVIEQIRAELQGTAPGRRATTPSQLLDLLERLGALTLAEAQARCESDAGRFLAQLEEAGLARPLPPELAPWVPGRAQAWVPAALLERLPATNPGPALRRVLAERYAAHQGPFTLEEAAAHLGQGAWLAELLADLEGEGTLVRGAFREGIEGEEWCAAQLLRRIHWESLAAARRAVEPVPLEQVQALALRWQGVGPGEEGSRRTASLAEASPAALEEDLEAALVPLRGWLLSPSLWEAVLGARLPAFPPGLLRAGLEYLLRSGHWLWVGGEVGGLPACALFERDRWREVAGVWAWPAPPAGGLEGQVLALLEARGALFWDEFLERLPGTSPERLEAALWTLARQGWVTHDSLEALRLWEEAPPGQEGPAPAAPPAPASGLPSPWPGLPGRRSARLAARRRIRQRLGRDQRRRRALAAGRWSLLPGAPVAGPERMPPGGTLGTPFAVPPSPSGGAEDESPRPQALTVARLLLERYGLVTRELFDLAPLGRWDEVVEALLYLEAVGEVRRGLFVRGLSGLQFGLPEGVELLRDRPDPETAGTFRLLAALDPANLWPTLRRSSGDPHPSHPPAIPRRPGVWVLFQGPRPVLVLEVGPQRLTPLEAWEGLGEAGQRDALGALVAQLPRVGLQRVRVGWWGDAPILDQPVAAVLQQAGFQREPNGLVWMRLP